MRAARHSTNYVLASTVLWSACCTQSEQPACSALRSRGGSPDVRCSTAEVPTSLWAPRSVNALVPAAVLPITHLNKVYVYR